MNVCVFRFSSCFHLIRPHIIGMAYFYLATNNISNCILGTRLLLSLPDVLSCEETLLYFNAANVFRYETSVESCCAFVV